ncbi:MAG: putative Ig domain-containing protein [Verrucomicrobiales bacterium]|nr:putative Ig domain-containing protein [Verrucomicrobiales bacterium]
MKRLVLPLLLAAGTPMMTKASTAFGDLNNFDVINDTGGRCHGFEIEIEGVRSTDLTYTYDWNHYGAPRIIQDDSVPGTPRLRVRYESVRQADGSFASFTNPQDPAHPLTPTDGHACTDPSVNLGCEHFGVGFYANPGTIRYFWLVEDPAAPGSLMRGPLVNVATPQFIYVPPAAPGAPAQVQVVMEPPEEPEADPAQFGTPIWVKSLKTVQKSGEKVELRDLLTDDESRDDDIDWAGEEEIEVEVEWTIFQKRPVDDPEAKPDEMEGQDDLPEGDETVTRRYEFYTYLGPVNPEDGEAKCDNPEDCPEAIGAYIGAQMAAFNIGIPLGLIDHLQPGELGERYVDRSVVVGGDAPYLIEVSGGRLPEGMTLDPLTGVLSGTPAESGEFRFVVDVMDLSEVVKAQSYVLEIREPLSIESLAVPGAQVGESFTFAFLGAGGVPPYFWSGTGLPDGLHLGQDGAMTGIPALESVGEHLLEVSLADSRGVKTSALMLLVVSPPPPIRGDVDGDRDVDRNDLSLILAARNRKAVGANDPRDLDGDGVITVKDARIVVTLFTRAL